MKAAEDQRKQEELNQCARNRLIEASKFDSQNKRRKM